MTTADFELKFPTVISFYGKKDWGFTGSRAGMTAVQYDWCRKLLKAGQPDVLRHGGAFGADTQVHALWREERTSGKCEVWPADDKRHAMFLNQRNVIVQTVMGPLYRNQEIVTRSTFLFATPHTQHEVIRSGTWHTVRHAAKANVPTLICWPNGKLTLHRDGILYRII